MQNLTRSPHTRKKKLQAIALYRDGNALYSGLVVSTCSKALENRTFSGSDLVTCGFEDRERDDAAYFWPSLTTLSASALTAVLRGQLVLLRKRYEYGLPVDIRAIAGAERLA